MQQPPRGLPLLAVASLFTSGYVVASAYLPSGLFACLPTKAFASVTKLLSTIQGRPSPWGSLDVAKADNDSLSQGGPNNAVVGHAEWFRT